MRRSRLAGRGLVGRSRRPRAALELAAPRLALCLLVTTLFISDLHLDGARPDITDQFLDFLEREARSAQALYILGDLFEAWIGDDDPDPDKRRVVGGDAQRHARGVPCYVMHGNRDFLLGQAILRGERRATASKDGTVVDLYGRRVLLMHGDTLCTDDHAYQRLRRIVRNPLVQFVLRSLSLRQRQRLAETNARRQQGTHRMRWTGRRPTSWTSISRRSRRTLRTLRRRLHHSRPHASTRDTRAQAWTARRATRIVLGDWYDQGSVLRWNERGFELAGLKRA